MLFAEPAPAPKEEGPAGGQTCPEDISRNKEEAEEDDQEEGDGQRTGELVKRHLEAGSYEIAGFPVLAVGQQGQNINQDVHVTRCPGHRAKNFNSRAGEAHDWRDQH